MLVLVSAGAIVFNFNSFLMGNPVDITHFVVSFVYVITHISVIATYRSRKSVNRFSLIVWLITTLTLGMMTFVNLNPEVMNNDFMAILYPLAFLFVAPLYGFNYFFIQIPSLVGFLFVLSALLFGFSVVQRIKLLKT